MTADCKYEEKMWLLQENNMKIAPNMLNNIFIALRTPQSPRLLRNMHPVCQHFARLHAPCAQAAVEQKRRCRGNFLPRRGKFLPRRGNFFPRHLLSDGRCTASTRCHEEERALREVFSSPHPFPAGLGAEKRRCYVKNFTYDVSIFTYDVIFFT